MIANPRPQESKCQRHQTQGSRIQELLTHREEAAVRTPTVAKPTEAEAALRPAPAEASHAAAATNPRDGTERHDWEFPLDVRISRAESQKFFNRCWTKSELVHFRDRVFRRNVAVEVNEFDFSFLLAFTLHRESVGRDVAVFPVVATGSDHLFQTLVVVHLEGELLRQELSELQCPADAFAIREVGFRIEHIREDACFQNLLHAFGVHAFLAEELNKQFRHLVVSDGGIHVVYIQSERCPIMGSDCFVVARGQSHSE